MKRYAGLFKATLSALILSFVLCAPLALAEPLLDFLVRTSNHRPTPENIARLKLIFDRLFGEGHMLTHEDWPYQYPGYKIELNEIIVLDNSPTVRFSLIALDPITHERMTEIWIQEWKSEHDRLILTIDEIGILPKHRIRSQQIGRLLIESQIKFLLKHDPENGRIALGTYKVGTYTWATHGFRFSNSNYLYKIKDAFRTFLAAKKIELTEKELSLFISPHHFAAFTDGTLRIISTQKNQSLKLTAEQLAKNSLTSIANEFPLTATERSSGLTQRLAVHLGKEFLLGLDTEEMPSAWGVKGGGRWDGKISVSQLEDNEEMEYAKAFPTLKEKAFRVLSPEYQKLIHRLNCQRLLADPESL